MSIRYGRTKRGQLLYDLGFTDLSARYLAKKHHTPIANIRTMRALRAIKALRQSNGLSNKPQDLR